MMMILGMFVFSLNTIAYQQLQRQTTWRHVSHDRVGDMPDYQYAGKGADVFTLNATISHEIQRFSGVSLDALRLMANTGKSFLLMEGTGKIYGFVVIQDVSETKTEFFTNGQPRLTEFSITLEKVKDHGFGIIGDLLQYGVQLIRKL